MRATEDQKKKYKEYYQANKDRLIQKRHKWNAENKESVRWQKLYKKYGVSKNEYEKMYSDQKGECAICKKHYNVLTVDHNHVNKKVRGLLCGKCNMSIGLLNDSSEILKNALKYLKDTK